MELSRIGPYRIVRKLGEGGIGTVYQAEHEEIARSVAIKVLRASEAGDAEYAARLLNEARAVNIIRHRGIVGISDLGRLPDGSPYIVMEYLDGETLRAAMRRRLPAVTLLRLARQVASALAAAHEKGILHREVLLIDSDCLRSSGKATQIRIQAHENSHRIRNAHISLSKLGRYHACYSEEKSC